MEEPYLFYNQLKYNIPLKAQQRKTLFFVRLIMQKPNKSIYQWWTQTEKGNVSKEFFIVFHKATPVGCFSSQWHCSHQDSARVVKSRRPQSMDGDIC